MERKGDRMERRSQARNHRPYAKLSMLITIALLASLLLCPAELWAKPVNAGQAAKAVRGWLKVNSEPLGTALGRQIRKVDTFTDGAAEPIYYVVYLQPSGFVIVPADDLVEPIIAFVATGSFDPSDDNPLGALVTGDVPARVAVVRGLAQQAGSSARKKDALKAKGKWAKLHLSDDTVGITGVSGISDVWVAPLTQSTWDQGNVGGYSNTESCYNYYTDPGPDGSNTNFPCGCVAAAMAQLIRYHEYPGSGPSGTYVWSNMPLQPEVGVISLAERQAIGHLCYDAAESVDTTYGAGGSTASLYDGCRELRDTFNYTNSIHGYNNYSNIGTSLTTMINPNLDADHVVIIGIHSPYPGHAVVCDGYGYNSSTLYHHLNMGWSGRDNAWYNLPTIVGTETGYQSNIVDTCVYNVFTSGSGQIISGRITGPAGIPISDATITATGGGTYYATSNSEGIYALAKIPSSRSFTISVDKGDWIFSNRVVSTGTSIQDSTTCGNRWGIDFTGTISAGIIELREEAYVAPESISIRLVDSDLQGGGSQDVVLRICDGDEETVTLSENPGGSGVFEGSIPTAAGAAVVEDGTVQVLGSKIVIGVYEDADDGTGSPATARDTAILADQATVIYQTNFTGGLPGGWSTVNGGSTADTWSATTEWGSRTSAYWTGTFMIADSDLAGNGTTMDEELITSGIDCSDYRNVTLKFNHYFRYSMYNWDEICDVDVRVDGGDWENIATYRGQDAQGVVELPLSPFGADGNPNVQIRWHYYNALWEYWWGIDDVSISGVQVAEGIRGDLEPDCDVDFYDYAVFALAWRCSPADADWNPACDISDPKDDLVNEKDLGVFSDNWLVGMSQ